MTPPPVAFDAAFHAANAAGWQVKGTTRPNPAVGAVILSADGEIVGVGATRPPGGPHAEVVALREAGEKARGGTAVVTLEPCNHTGRTGPCSHALAQAGVARVYYAHPDPSAVAGGGADFLRSRGIAAERFVPPEPTAADTWVAAQRLGRPHVTAKFAQTLDGFTAAPDGTSQWITGEPARRRVHLDRSRRDAIIVGTGTYLADHPRLTARRPGGELYPTQPRRIAIGTRAVSGIEQHATIDAALAALWADGVTDVLVEGGAGLLTSFFRAGLVDAIQAYVAPVLLGGGLGVLTDALAGTLADAPRFSTRAVTRLGDDVLIELT